MHSIQGIVSIECYEEIPCNVCEKTCPFSAIFIGDDISSLPRLDKMLCTSCGLCMAHCPGQAISIVTPDYSDKEALVKLLYDYLPLPKIGTTAKVFNREGRTIGQGEVKFVKTNKGENTALVTVVVPKSIAWDVKRIEVEN